MGELANIKNALLLLKPELASRYHVSSIGIFGSVARNNFSPESDIDIIVGFNRKIGIEFIDLAEYLETALGKKIDLVSRNGIREKYFKAIESEVIYV